MITVSRRPGRHRHHVRRAAPLAAGLALSTAVLAACGGGSSSGTSGGGSGKTVLEIGMWTNPPAISAIQHIDRLFEKQNPKVTIKLDQAPTANNAWSTLFNTLVSSKSVSVLADYGPVPSVNAAPASTGIKAGGMLAQVEAGDLVNLANEPYMKYYSKSEQTVDDGYKGGIYGLQAAEYSQYSDVWYKSAILKKYHLALPTTFSQLLSDCAVLKKHGITPFFVAGNTGLETTVLEGIVDQLAMQGRPSSSAADVEISQEKKFLTGAQSWDSPLFKKAIQEYQQLMDGNIETDASGVAQLNAPSEWAANSNNYAFLVDGTWDGPVIKQANPKLAFGDFTLPGTNDPAANREMLEVDLCWTILKGAPHQALAQKWLDFFSQPSNYSYWLKNTGSLSLEPAIKTKDPWMSWDNSHLANAMVGFGMGGWIPTGASTPAEGPYNSTNLAEIAPLGTKSPSSLLPAEAAAYAKAIKK